MWRRSTHLLFGTFHSVWSSKSENEDDEEPDGEARILVSAFANSLLTPGVLPGDRESATTGLLTYIYSSKTLLAASLEDAYVLSRDPTRRCCYFESSRVDPWGTGWERGQSSTWDSRQATKQALIVSIDRRVINQTCAFQWVYSTCLKISTAFCWTAQVYPEYSSVLGHRLQIWI
jgi:hypothetical protein